MRLKSTRRTARLAAFFLSVILVCSLIVPIAFAETAGSHPLFLLHTSPSKLFFANLFSRKNAPIKYRGAEKHASRTGGKPPFLFPSGLTQRFAEITVGLGIAPSRGNAKAFPSQTVLPVRICTLPQRKYVVV